MIMYMYINNTLFAGKPSYGSLQVKMYWTKESKYWLFKTSSPKGNDRSPGNKQVFLNSSLVSKRFFQLVKGSQLCSPWLTKF